MLIRRSGRILTLLPCSRRDQGRLGELRVESVGDGCLGSPECRVVAPHARCSGLGRTQEVTLTARAKYSQVSPSLPLLRPFTQDFKQGKNSNSKLFIVSETLYIRSLHNGSDASKVTNINLKIRYETKVP